MRPRAVLPTVPGLLVESARAEVASVISTLRQAVADPELVLTQVGELRSALGMLTAALRTLDRL